MQVMTVVEGKVPPSKLEEFQSAYAEVGKDSKPAGWVRSMLLHDTSETGLFRISTLWENREALDKMRGSTKVPVAVALFRTIGTEPTVRIFAVPMTIER